MIWNNSSIITHICLGTWQRHTRDQLKVTLCACVLCAKLLQSCPTLCNSMNYTLSGSSVHGDPPDKNTGVGCHVFLQGVFPTQILCLMHWAGGVFFHHEHHLGSLERDSKGEQRKNPSLHSQVCSSHYYNPAPNYRKYHKTAFKGRSQEIRFRH